jgi:hypothetical protein
MMLRGPGEGSIGKYLQVCYALLHGNGEVAVSDLEERHAEMRSSLHTLASSKEVDISAFLYSIRRLPPFLESVESIYMGQNESVLAKLGIVDLKNHSHWRPARAQSRNRFMLSDGGSRLVVFICSLSDVDDLISSLTCFQIEWNKMHSRLDSTSLGRDLASGSIRAEEVGDRIRKTLGVSQDSWMLLWQVWGQNWNEKMRALAKSPKNFKVIFSSDKPDDYQQIYQAWWSLISDHFQHLDLSNRPVYFVSSNDYSLTDLLSGYAFSHRGSILDRVMDANKDGLNRIWRLIQSDDEPGRQENLLYHALQSYLEADPARMDDMMEMEEESGILRHEGSEALDIKCQMIEVCRLRPERMDQRLHLDGMEMLRQSRALILNIEYPLGMAAYYLLSQICSSQRYLEGIYIMGKAASMQGRLGDVMIPVEVYDMHSKNNFAFHNCFSMRDIVDMMMDSAVFDSQKAITVRGTFLHNREMMERFKRDDYNGIEMEAGPYLRAVYESTYKKRCPSSAMIDLMDKPKQDLGMLHYASDTPYSKRVSLLSEKLGFVGVEAIYACSIAILRRIMMSEIQKEKKGAKVIEG